METAIWIIACIILCFIASNQAWQKTVLKATVNRQKEIIELQRETIANQNGTIETYKSILAGGVSFPNDKPYWLNEDLIKQIKELWNTANTDNSNPRVQAYKIIQEKSLGLDKRKLSLEEAVELIKKHCLK